MEYLNGGSLKDRQAQIYSLEEFFEVSRQICEGLSFAHKNRIVHGNLRTSNILFTRAGRVKLTDFGLNEHYAKTENWENWFNPTGEPKSVAADILAAGVIFYQMLTGSMPRWKGDILKMEESLFDLPDRLHRMLTRMLSIDKRKRPASFNEIIHEIREISRDTSLPEMSEKKTIIMDGTARPDSRADISNPRSWRRIAAFLVPGILLLTALGYLFMSGKIPAIFRALSKLH